MSSTFVNCIKSCCVSLFHVFSYPFRRKHNQYNKVPRSEFDIFRNGSNNNNNNNHNGNHIVSHYNYEDNILTDLEQEINEFVGTDTEMAPMKNNENSNKNNEKKSTPLKLTHNQNNKQSTPHTVPKLNPPPNSNSNSNNTNNNNNSLNSSFDSYYTAKTQREKLLKETNQNTVLDIATPLDNIKDEVEDFYANPSYPGEKLAKHKQGKPNQKDVNDGDSSNEDSYDEENSEIESEIEAALSKAEKSTGTNKNSNHTPSKTKSNNEADITSSKKQTQLKLQEDVDLVALMDELDQSTMNHDSII